MTGRNSSIEILACATTFDSVTSMLQSPSAWLLEHSGNGQSIPCIRAAVAGYVIFCRVCISGKHCLHSELPHGSVMGSRRSNEHSGHCSSLTIRRASSNPLSCCTSASLACVAMGVGGLGSAGRSAEDARGTELGGTASSLCSDMNVRFGEGASVSRTRCRGSRACALRRRVSFSFPRPASIFLVTS